MRDLLSLVITIVGCIIFIQLLPTLIWLFLIIMAAAFLYTTYQRYKYVRYQKEIHEKTDNTTQYQSTNTTINPDVIDVEYTESEEEVS